MCIVQVIRRRDRYIVESTSCATFAFHEGVKPLEFGEKLRLRKVAIENTDGIIHIHGCYKVVIGVLDGFHMARRDVPSGTDKSKAFHVSSLHNVISVFSVHFTAIDYQLSV